MAKYRDESRVICGASMMTERPGPYSRTQQEQLKTVSASAAVKDVPTASAFPQCYVTLEYKSQRWALMLEPCSEP